MSIENKIKKQTISLEDGDKILNKDKDYVKELNELETEFRILKQLIDLRLKRKVTQIQLANIINIKQSNIARLESGEILPSFKSLRRYASGLNCNLDIKLIQSNNKDKCTFP